MKTRIFTSGILVRNGRMLILKRKMDDERNPGRWDCLGGHFLESESAEECMLREALEESGLKVRIKKSGRVYEFEDKYGRGVGLPFLLECDSASVKLSEHSEYRWVGLDELSRYDCVPEIKLSVRSLNLRH